MPGVAHEVRRSGAIAIVRDDVSWSEAEQATVSLLAHGFGGVACTLTSPNAPDVISRSKTRFAPCTMDVPEVVTPADLIVVTRKASGTAGGSRGGEPFGPVVATFVLDRPRAGDALAADDSLGIPPGDVERGRQGGATSTWIALGQSGNMVSASRDVLDAALAPSSTGIAP